MRKVITGLYNYNNFFFHTKENKTKQKTTSLCNSDLLALSSENHFMWLSRVVKGYLIFFFLVSLSGKLESTNINSTDFLSFQFPSGRKKIIYIIKSCPTTLT